MMSRTKKEQAKIEKVLEELDKIPNAKTREKAEELHQKLSYMSVEDLFKFFTI